MAVSLVSTGVQFPDSTIQTTAATAGAPSSWVYLSTTTASTSATIDVENAFNSTYATYVIVMNNVTTNTDSVNLQCQLKLAGAYYTGNYRGHIMDPNANTSGYSGFGYSPNSFITLGRYLGASGSSWPYTGILYLPSPWSTLGKQVYGQYVVNQFSSGFTSMGVFGGAAYNQTSACTGVRFYLSSGSMVQGTFTLYGIKAS